MKWEVETPLSLPSKRNTSGRKMETADQLCEELSEAESALKPCPACKGKLLIRYEPGLTKLACHVCGVINTLPDWQPENIAREYNQKYDNEKKRS